MIKSATASVLRAYNPPRQNKLSALRHILQRPHHAAKVNRYPCYRIYIITLLLCCQYEIYDFFVKNCFWRLRNYVKRGKI